MVVHHFPRDRLRFIFQGFYSQLNDHGIILIERASGNKGGMPYGQKGQWEASDQDRRFRDSLVLLLLELGFSVRTKVSEQTFDPLWTLEWDVNWINFVYVSGV